MTNYTDPMDRPYPNVISFVAKGTNSGKTYLMERLITELKRRGRNVTAVKHAMHGHTVDPEGKDTFKFAQRGADRVILFSPDGLLMYEASHPETDYLYTLASQDMDIVLVEGFKSGPFRKIEVFNEENYATPLCVEEPGQGFLAIVSRAPVDTDIPQFRFEDIESIAAFIEEHTCRSR
jgi:molybdopterin-guanine dinucleotide biosynthesis adapter protein